MKIKKQLTFFKSLRFRIMVLLVVIGILPCLITERFIVRSYEKQAVEMRKINVKNQCDILGNQLMKEGYLNISSQRLLIKSFLCFLLFITAESWLLTRAAEL